MLVLIAGRDPTRNAGGAESYMVGQALAAQRAGYAPHMLVLGRRTETITAEFGTLHRVATPLRPILAHSAIIHRPWLLPAVLRLLREQPGPHLIHAHSGWSRIAADAAARLNAAGTPTSTLASFYATVGAEQKAKFDGALVRQSWLRTARFAAVLAYTHAVSIPNERRGYRAADLVAVNYETVRRLLSDSYGPARRIERVDYAAPAAFRDGPARTAPASTGTATTAAAPTGTKPTILTVSRHSPRKGLDILIRALAELRDRGVVFNGLLIGSGSMLAAHRALVRKLGLEREVALPGSVANVWGHLRACDVFVLPSTSESSGSMSVLEAMQAGAPIVAAAIDGIVEDLAHERDALLVPPGSTLELADALARMLADEPLRRRIGAEARATFERRFAAEPASDALARMYRSLGLSPGRT